MTRQEYHKQWYLKNRLRILAQSKLWRENNKERSKERIKEWNNNNKERKNAKAREWHKNNPEKSILLSVRKKCKTKNIPFNLELEDIIIPTHCPYLGIELTYTREKEDRRSTMSIDRIDPKKGYVKGNIQIISELANRMKTDASKEELLSFAKSIIKIYCNKEEI